MITDFVDLIQLALDGQTYSGPYANNIPSAATYPKVRYYLISDQFEDSKDASLYGLARFQVDVYAPDTDAKSGIQSVTELGDLLAGLNGELPSAGNIIEIRIEDRDLDYDEETEAHIMRLKYIVQHK